MTLFRNPLVVLDTETTGLTKHSWAQVVELAGVMLDEDGQEAGAFERLIRCDPPAGADEALRMNGITREMLLEQGHLGTEVVADFRRFVGPMPVTSFNVGFDQPMLVRLGGLGDLRWGKCIMLAACDDMGAAGALPMAYGRPKWPKLSEAVAHYQTPPREPAHRALADARMAADVLVQLRRKGAI